MRDKLTDFMRIGKVSAIFPEKCTAEVTFEDRGNTVSRELFVVVPFTLKDKAYHMPAVEERVVCCFDPGAPSIGYILGSFYADSRTPPYGDENKTYLRFEDQALLAYDKKEHALTIHIPEAGKASVDVSAAGAVTVKSDDVVHIEASGSVAIKAPQLHIEADITHTGEMVTSGQHVDSVGTHG